MPWRNRSSKWLHFEMSIMLIIRRLRNANIFLRRETISTALVNYKDAESSDTPQTESDVDTEEKPRVISLDTSIRYLKSEAYKKAYGDLPVWTHYKRNFKGQIPPETRTDCFRDGKLATGSPCPICRDEYLVVDYRNLDLIKQFVSPYGGQILKTLKTGVCQTQHNKLVVAIEKAKNYGFLSTYVPFRTYDYNFYIKK